MSTLIPTPIARLVGRFHLPTATAVVARAIDDEPATDHPIVDLRARCGFRPRRFGRALQGVEGVEVIVRRRVLVATERGRS